MGEWVYRNKHYKVDDDGFLLNPAQWDANFAEGMASKLQIPQGLTGEHWRIINFIRDTYLKIGRCPLVYQTCKLNGIHLKELKALFPTGYLRGACKLAGISYREGYMEGFPSEGETPDQESATAEKTYQVDVRGFLIDPFDWDEQYAIFKAYEMKMPEKLNESHWQIIRFLREFFRKNHRVPTVYETCESLRLSIEELERLFPDGYHRGAVKIAGLRVR
ncbi:MAG: TusE/DsrC/DsvC family sulfur relay protein [bacterium]